MDATAEVLSRLLGWPELELTWMGLGNMNYCFEGRGPNGSQVFVKSFAARLYGRGRNYRSTERRYRTERDVLATCEEAGLPVPATIAVSDKDKILVQQYVGAADAKDFLLHGGDSHSLLSALGLWVGLFHALLPVSQRPADRVLARIEGHLASIELSVPRAIERRLKAQPWPMVLCRNDCHLSNFLVSADGLIGIDFEMCSPGFAGLDLGALFVHYVLASRGGPSALEAPESFQRELQTLLSSYNEVSDLSVSDLRIFVSLALSKMANRRSSWRNLLSKAERRWLLSI